MQAFKTIILWLTLLASSWLPAFALMPTVPENHIWEIFSTWYDAAGTPITIGYDNPVKPTSAYDQSPIHGTDAETRSSEAERTLFGQSAEFKAAEEAGAVGKPLYCFPKGTKVETSSGKRNIEDIKVGDKVLSYDLEKKKVVERAVTQLIRKATQHWYQVRVGNEVIKATGAHPFWIVNKERWISARDLKSGMELRKLDGSIVKISSVEMEKLTQPENTYNLEVEHDHDYFAGTMGCTVLVHNTDPNDILFSRDPAAIQSTDTFLHGPWAGRTLGEALNEASSLGQLPEGLSLRD